MLKRLGGRRLVDGVEVATGELGLGLGRGGHSLFTRGRSWANGRSFPFRLASLRSQKDRPTETPQVRDYNSPTSTRTYSNPTTWL